MGIDLFEWLDLVWWMRWRKMWWEIGQEYEWLKLWLWTWDVIGAYHHRITKAVYN